MSTALAGIEYQLAIIANASKTFAQTVKSARISEDGEDPLALRVELIALQDQRDERIREATEYTNTYPETAASMQAGIALMTERIELIREVLS